MIEEREARMGLCAAHSAGDVGLAKLVREQGACDVWSYLRDRAPGGALASKVRAVNVADLHEQTSACGARFITPCDDEWPLQLADLSWSASVGGFGGNPLGLWIIGQMALDQACAKSVAIVGARASTGYGEHVASEMAFGLAERTYTIISGGAYGIDACAHRGAINAGGITVAVMAGGLAEFYPPGNSALIRKVAEVGAVVSECPPLQPPSKAGFLVRNRLIAALSRATVIVEGAVRSGAQNTVSWALATGRPVGAVPGPVTSAMSATPHRLIREGEAVLTSTVDDIVAIVEPVNAETEQRAWDLPNAQDHLPAADKQVLDALPRRRTLSLDELCDMTGEPALGLLITLAHLREAGFAEEAQPGLWRATRRSHQSA